MAYRPTLMGVKAWLQLNIIFPPKQGGLYALAAMPRCAVAATRKASEPHMHTFGGKFPH
jgi:hypothetical protein